MSLLCSSIFPCSPSPIPIEARVLCEAAESLKRLSLEVDEEGSCTSEALAEVFDFKPLEELDLSLWSAVTVCCACSPAMYTLKYTNFSSN